MYCHWLSLGPNRLFYKESMMKIERHGDVVKLWLSADDTYQWANGRAVTWPCSRLAGKKLFAEFCDGDLVDYSVDGKCGCCTDIPADEFNAITSDFLKLEEL
jgi:hypothetical protein